MEINDMKKVELFMCWGPVQNISLVCDVRDHLLETSQIYLSICFSLTI